MKPLTIILFVFLVVSFTPIPPRPTALTPIQPSLAPIPRTPQPATHHAPRADAPYTIRILCLYGSVPAKGYWNVEPFHGPHNMINWVAKLHGGHVGVEYEPGKVLSFQPQTYGGLAASGHFLPNFRKRNFNSCFRTVSVSRMWNCLGNRYDNIDSLRRAVFVIPITATQRQALDSLATRYTNQTPYDYAFFGMRCASSTYDVLQSAGILPPRDMTWYSVFTTQEFRYLIYQEYLKNKDKGWELYTWHGSLSRKWEKDVENWSKFK